MLHKVNKNFHNICQLGNRPVFSEIKSESRWTRLAKQMVPVYWKVGKNPAKFEFAGNCLWSAHLSWNRCKCGSWSIGATQNISSTCRIVESHSICKIWLELKLYIHHHTPSCWEVECLQQLLWISKLFISFHIHPLFCGCIKPQISHPCNKTSGERKGKSNFGR